MSEKTTIKIITTKKGLKVLTNFLKYYKDKELLDTIMFADTFEIYEDVIYLSWDNISSGRAKLVKSAIMILANKNVTRKICVIERNPDNIWLSTYIEEKYEKKNFPHICLKCKFDEDKMKSQLEDYAKNSTKKRDKKEDS